jgi:hypothetical protein
MPNPEPNTPPDEDEAHALFQELLPFLEFRDGAATLAERLGASTADEFWIPNVRRSWELIGLRYFSDTPKPRPFEALLIFSALYEKMIQCQFDMEVRLHKGMPLLWMAECYAMLGFHTLRKRYLMLALCEDAITGNGIIDPENTGVYFRLVWRLGMRDEILKWYANMAKQVADKNEIESRFPEWVLQQLDQGWMIEFPSPEEANIYAVNGHYVGDLIGRLGGGDGKVLEKLAEYLMVCMPGCRVSRRARTPSTDYDLICSMDGFEFDFRSELGRYFVCECKDWKKPVDYAAMAKFCRVLDSVKSKFGVIFSKRGLSGSGQARFAEREQMKVFQDRGIVIVVIDKSDLECVAKGKNFVNLLRKKYEKVRLDLADGNL